MSRVDTAERLVPAAPEKVFAALLDPVALSSWLPPEGMTGWVEHFDHEPGGRYRLVLTYTDTSGASGKSNDDTDVVAGRSTEITPGDRVVQDADVVSDDPAS